VIAASLATAGLLAGLCAAVPVSPEGPAAAGTPPSAAPGDVRIDGDVTYEPGTGRVLVENGAVLRRGEVVIRARSFTYDPETGEVRAAGDVLLTDPTRVVAADALRAIVDGPWEATGVVAFVKDAPVDLSSATALEEARCVGRNRLTFRGERLRGEATGAFELDAARLTLCDCPGGAAPSWELTARRADVRPGERAILSWPVLRVTPRFLFIDHPVPVLALPWLYLPLGERQTGILLPEIRSVSGTGLRIAQPLFVTLGRSADLTLTPEYAFGRGDVDDGEPAVRGPGARLELRWAPAVGAEGWAEVAWVHDLDREAGGEGGDRLGVTGAHAQRLSDRTSLRTALRLAGDPVWARDFAVDKLAGSVPYGRSDLLLSHRRDPLVLEAGASYLQPLRPLRLVEGEDSGAFGAGLDAASRLPGASAALLPTAAGPVRLSGRAGLARYAPISASFDREGGRPAATRADAQVEAALPLLLGGAISLAPWARGGAAAYAFEGGLSGASNGWGVMGAVLGTELSRRFGALRHAIAPRLEWRWGTGVEGDSLSSPAYDAFDRAASGRLSSGPAGAWSQLRAAVETRLVSGAVDVLRLELGQDWDLRRGRFAETFTNAAFVAGRFAADVSARFLAVDGRPEVAAPPAIPSAFLDRFTELSAGAALSDRRGDALHARFFAVGPGGSGSLLAGLDPLFDLRPATGELAWATAGARAVAGPATFGYDAQFPGRATFVRTCAGGGGQRRVEGWQAQQHTASITWDSPCRCFRLAALVSVDDCAELSSYKVVLDLSGLGSARGGR
jgi:LPS-assembly protein